MQFRHINSSLVFVDRRLSSITQFRWYILPMHLCLLYNTHIVYNTQSYKNIHLSQYIIVYVFCCKSVGYIYFCKPTASGCTQAVTHPNTNQTQRCLTSLNGRDVAYSTCYDHWLLCLNRPYFIKLGLY